MEVECVRCNFSASNALNWSVDGGFMVWVWFPMGLSGVRGLRGS